MESIFAVMSGQPLINWKTVALNLRALSVGVCVAVALVTSYVFVKGKPADDAATAEGSHLLVPLGTQVCIAAWTSAVFGVCIILICAPIWTLMARYRLSGWVAAAVLGFVGTLGVWVVEEMQGHSIVEAATSGLVWAICGAVAGIATWWAGPKPRLE